MPNPPPRSSAASPSLAPHICPIREFHRDIERAHPWRAPRRVSSPLKFELAPVGQHNIEQHEMVAVMIAKDTRIVPRVLKDRIVVAGRITLLVNVCLVLGHQYSMAGTCGRGQAQPFHHSRKYHESVLLQQWARILTRVRPSCNASVPCPRPWRSSVGSSLPWDLVWNTGANPPSWARHAHLDFDPPNQSSPCFVRRDHRRLRVLRGKLRISSSTDLSIRTSRHPPRRSLKRTRTCNTRQQPIPAATC